MRIGFVETMSGTLRPLEAAADVPCAFTVAVSAPRARTFLAEGRTRATGIMRAPPWARAAPCEGEIALSLRHKRIAYALTFDSDTGARLRLAGHKSVRLLDLLPSMTTLPMTLTVEDGGAAGEPPSAVLARGTLTFDLNDLVPFARSLLPLGGDARMALAQARLRLMREVLER